MFWHALGAGWGKWRPSQEMSQDVAGLFDVLNIVTYTSESAASRLLASSVLNGYIAVLDQADELDTESPSENQS